MDTSADSASVLVTEQWAVLRPYVIGAFSLFVAGIAVGVGMVAANVDLFAALGLQNLEDVIPADFTVWTILANNTRAFLLMIVGAITAGLLTVFGLLVNGILVGYVTAPVALSRGIDHVLVLLLPHGIFELPALFVAAGVGFRLVHMGVDRIRGKRDHLVTRQEGLGLVAVIAIAWVALALAAMIEVYVTPTLYELLYDVAPSAV